MISIAIDGPSGAGKSTVARSAAKRFGFVYVDTGAIYRTIGLAAMNAGADTKDPTAVEAVLPTLNIELKYIDGEQRKYLDGKDGSKEIRLPEVSMCASNVSAMQHVRDYLTDMQRDLARKHNVIMDGRDIGTVILPNADLKIFLTASAEARAQRRWKELQAKGISDSFEEVLADMKKRDEQDTERKAAPLIAAADAVLLDTGSLTLEESIDAVCRLIAERTGAKAVTA